MKTGTKLNGFLAFSVVSLFFLCVLAVVLTGAKSYARQTERGERQFAARTAAHYLSNRLRQGESVTVTEFAGLSTLTIGETVEGKRYLTRIYSQDGMLFELYSPESAVLDPESGEFVLQLGGEVSFILEEMLLTVRLPGQELTFSLLGKGEMP